MVLQQVTGDLVRPRCWIWSAKGSRQQRPPPLDAFAPPLCATSPGEPWAAKHGQFLCEYSTKMMDKLEAFFNGWTWLQLQ